MDQGKWYNTEEMGLALFGKIPPKSNMVLSFNKSWTKEYFFKKEEIVNIKKRVREMRSGEHPPIALNARILNEIIPLKESKKESRLKKLNSIRFITDEI